MLSGLVDSFDWQMQPVGPKTPAQIDQNFQSWIDKATNGSFANSGAISLEHESNEYTMNKAMEWYPKLKQSFKHVMPVVSCQNIKHPYEEDAVTFASFNELAGNSQSGASHLSPHIIGVLIAVIVAAVSVLF